MAKRKEYPRVIVTDENGNPMAWSENQLCYCTDEYWQDAHFPVKSYLIATAKKHIRNTIAFRTKNKLKPGVYKTMPFAG